MAIIQGAADRHHRAFLTLGGVDWDEFEEMGGIEVTVDGEERFRQPGDVFESSSGGVYAVDAVDGKRHWRVGRDSPLLAQYLAAASNGVMLEGTLSYHELLGNGQISPAPYISADVMLAKAKGPDVGTSGDGAMFEVSLSITGAPR